MAVQLISAKHWPILEEAFQGANSKLRIMSPYIGIDLAKYLVKLLAKRPQVQCEFITRFSIQDFHHGASSVQAVELLQNAGVLIYALQGLHTKLYLMDDNVGLMGSANFTTGGFYLNHELSLYIKNESELLGQMHQYYQRVLDKITKMGNFRVDDVQIQWVMKELNVLGKKKIVDVPAYWQFGAQMTAQEASPPVNGVGDGIQEILRQKSHKKQDTTHIWLKFEGDAKSRGDGTESYVIRSTKEHPGGFICFRENKRPRGFQSGDWVFLAEVSTDGKGSQTPVIMGRAKTKTGFDGNNYVDKVMLEKYPWMEEYPWYIELEDAEYLNTSVANGISLLTLLENVGSDTYPATLGQGLPLAQLRKRHLRLSHLQITAMAKVYLDSQFIKKVAQFGTTKL